MTILAIDAATSGVTAVVVSETGDVVATGHRPLAQHVSEPGWVEHAPEELWRATLEATRVALTQVDASQLTGMGITNQRETVLLWDRDTLGSPRRAIAGSDRRGDDICARLRAAGHEERVAELSGLPLNPRFTATELTWLAEREPHTWALVVAGRYAVGTVDSYLIARMTRGLEHVTDVSNASRTLLLDLETGDWSDELCALFGVPRDALPDLVPSWGEVAVTDPATFLGLELPIAGLAGDRQAALFGQGCFEAGDAACTIDATSVALINTGPTLVRSAGLLTTAAWRSPSGELTYALEGDLETMQPPEGRLTTLRVDGAGAADDLVCQRLADRLGVPVERPELAGTAALGAALLAGLGTGVWASTDALRGTRRVGRTFQRTA